MERSKRRRSERPAIDGAVTVTGAAAGLGRASAIALAKAGAAVLVADIDLDGALATARAIERAGGRALAMAVDVTDQDTIKAMIETAEAELGPLAAAVNNAAVPGDGSDSEEEFDRVFAVNLDGVRLVMKHAVVAMSTRGRGSIVNVSSVAGLKPLPTGALYSASKAGVLGLTRAAARIYASRGVRINAICPGPFPTAMLTAAYGPEGAEQLAKLVPLGRSGRPEEVGEAICWLCSDASSYVNGHALVIDGGLSAW